MRVSVGLRLFVLVSAAMLLAGVASLLLVRWTLAGRGAGRDVAAERRQIADLAAHFGRDYPVAGAWAIPQLAPGQRERAWQAAVGLQQEEAGPSSLLADRASLRDAQGRLVAGRRVAPLLVALVSVDQVSRDVYAQGRKVGTVVVAQPFGTDDVLTVAFLMRQQARLGVAVGVAILLALLVSLVLTWWIRRPVQSLAQAALAWGGEQFGVRVVQDRRDELGDLARVFNGMANRLQLQEEARRQWVADTAHELRTPLAVVRAQLEAMQDGVRPATPEHLALLGRHLSGLERLVDDLQGLALAEAGGLAFDCETVDVVPLVTALWNAFAPRFATAGLSVAIREMPAALPARIDRQRLRQVLTNLLENSVRHTVTGGQVVLSVESAGDGGRIVLEDSAPGLPDAMLGRLGERFFRADPSRDRASGGAGIGLALSRALLEHMGGSLQFGHAALGGLRVTVNLPGEC